MKNQRTTSKSDALTRLFKATFIAGILPASLLLLSVQSSDAGSATWNLSPTSYDWNTTANWTPATVPNGPGDTATFDVSNTTFIFTGYTSLELNGIVFDPGASGFTISLGEGLTLSGSGITNNSGITQNVYVGDYAAISFTDNATAGSLTAFTIAGYGCDPGGRQLPGYTTFSGTSSAGNATFTNLSTVCSESSGASTSFSGSSTAADGTFINYGASSCTDYLSCQGSTVFFDTSTAGNATLIAYGGFGPGSIYFSDDSTGGTARVELFDGGMLDISGHNVPGVTVGSIEGTGGYYGSVFLGDLNLTVGGNNLSTAFSGVIQDGNFYGGSGPGSLTKIGTGTLTLTGANTYTGGTSIERGTLAVSNASGSGTGTGAVQVKAASLSGTGIISGAVTVGTGQGGRAVLGPGEGERKAGTLTIQSTLTFNSEAIYKCELKTKRAVADKVVANGVIINHGARFSFVSCGERALRPGTVFTLIDNTAVTPIAGTFGNLPDGSIFTIGNTYQVSYEGNDGNDLTLTVVLAAFAVTTTDPACDSIINMPPNDFVVNLTEAADPATVQAIDFTVNGTPADSFVLSNGNATITFHFNSSPVVRQGLQTMHIPAGALNRASDNQSLFDFTCTFCYAITPLQVTTTNPPVGSTFSPPAPGDYPYDVNFNQAVDPASVDTSDLTLTGNVGGSVSAVQFINGNTTARFTVHFDFGGSVTASVGAGTITANHCNGNAAFTGDYTVEGCPLHFYTTATGAGTITSGGAEIGNHCDDCNTLVNLPFPVSLYGTPISLAYAGSNGSLQFSTMPNPEPAFFDQCLPVNPDSGGPFLNTLFPYYDDLRTDTCADCGIFTQTLGTPPARQFVIRYKTGYFNHPGTAEFEVLLTEGSDTVSVIYGVSDNNGAEAASGIQQDLSRFTSFSCNEAVLTPGLRVDYIPTPCFTGGD